MASKSKTLYHSELVSLGIVEIQVTGNPTASKFAGKPDFIGVILGGEERLLTLENEAIKEFFSGQKGQRFHVKATGGKGNASIAFVEDPAEAGDNSNPDLAPEKTAVAPTTLNPPKPPPAPIEQKPAATAPAAQSAPLTHTAPQSPVPPRPAPAPTVQKTRAQAEREMIEKTCLGAIRLRNVVKLAFVNALKLKKEIEEEWPGQKISEPQLQGFVGTLAIQLFIEGAQRGMPERKVMMEDPENGHQAPAGRVSHAPELSEAELGLRDLEGSPIDEREEDQF